MSSRKFDLVGVGGSSTEDTTVIDADPANPGTSGAGTVVDIEPADPAPPESGPAPAPSPDVSRDADPAPTPSPAPRDGGPPSGGRQRGPALRPAPSVDAPAVTPADVDRAVDVAGGAVETGIETVNTALAGAGGDGGGGDTQRQTLPEGGITPGATDPIDDSIDTLARDRQGPVKDVITDAGGVVEDASRAAVDTAAGAAEPVSDIAGSAIGQINTLTSRPDLVQESVESGEIETDPAVERGGTVLTQNLITGAAGATLGLPAEAVRTGSLAGEATQFTAAAVDEQGAGGLETAGAAATATGAAVAADIAASAQENPVAFTGQLAGGIAGGFGAGRLLEVGTGRVRTRVEGRGGPAVKAEDTTTEPATLETGDQPTFDTDRNAPGREAVAEMERRASDQPDALQEAAGSDQVVLRSESDRLPGDLEAQRGNFELPGLFASGDFPPLRSDLRSAAASLTPRLPRPFPEPERTTALEAPEIDAMPDAAAGSGFALRRTDTDEIVETGVPQGQAAARADADPALERVPDPTEPGVQFLDEQAERGTFFVRAPGDRTPEFEGVFPPETRFTRETTGRIDVGRTGGTLDVFRLADDQPDAPGGTVEAADTQTLAEISQSRSAGGPPSGPPVSPFGVTPETGAPSTPGPGPSATGGTIGPLEPGFPSATPGVDADRSGSPPADLSGSEPFGSGPGSRPGAGPSEPADPFVSEPTSPGSGSTGVPPSETTVPPGEPSTPPGPPSTPGPSPSASVPSSGGVASPADPVGSPGVALFDVGAPPSQGRPRRDGEFVTEPAEPEPLPAPAPAPATVAFRNPIAGVFDGVFGRR